MSFLEGDADAEAASDADWLACLVQRPAAPGADGFASCFPAACGQVPGKRASPPALEEAGHRLPGKTRFSPAPLQVSVALSSSSIRVAVLEESGERVLMEGTFTHRINTESSLWSLEPGKCVLVSAGCAAVRGRALPAGRLLGVPAPLWASADCRCCLYSPGPLECHCLAP